MQSKQNFMAKSWKELGKSGGLAPPAEEIKKYISSRGDIVLSRDDVVNCVQNYFLSCIGEVENEETGEKETIWKKNPTKSGLAIALGISAETLIDYVSGRYSNGKLYTDNPDVKRVIANDDFDILRRAYQLISEYYESKLGENRNPAGIIYWLNNSKNGIWSNEQQVKITPVAQSKHESRPSRTPEEIAAAYGRSAELSDTTAFPELPEIPD